MNISRRGIDLVKHFEGCKLEAYPDPGTGGDPWTIGWGHTGAEVVAGLVWTQDEADAALLLDLAAFEECVERYVEPEITQNQFDALVCFAYNVGCKALKDSTLMRLVNWAEFDKAREQFGRWNKSGGRVMEGLTRRRAAEAALFGET